MNEKLESIRARYGSRFCCATESRDWEFINGKAYFNGSHINEDGEPEYMRLIRQWCDTNCIHITDGLLIDQYGNRYTYNETKSISGDPHPHVKTTMPKTVHAAEWGKHAESYFRRLSRHCESLGLEVSLNGLIPTIECNNKDTGFPFSQR